MNADHIIIVNDFAHVNGGTATIALGSAKGLAKRGFRVTLFSAVGPVDPDLCEVDGLEVVCLGTAQILEDPNRLRAMATGIWNRAAGDRFRALLANCDRERTVVHVHGWTKALSASVVRAALEERFPVVLTLHDYFAACPVGTFFQFPQKQICPLRPMSAECVALNCDSRHYSHKVWRVGRQWVQTHPGMLPTGIREFISISDLSEEVLRPYLPAGSRVHRVCNFTEVPKTEPVRVEENSLFAYSGRFSAEKGVELFAQAAAKTEVPVLFLGEGSLRGEIQRLAPQAEFTGWLPAAKAREELRRARVLVFPSLWYETQGLVVAEAAAMGIPAIVPDTCAAREWVADGVTGLWFKGGDANSLEQRLRELRDQPKLAAELGRKAYERYWEHPATVDAHCRGLEAVYGQMLGKTPVPETEAHAPATRV